MPPHIAAGINLNFWPAGPIFRHGGAFIIRRTFRAIRSTARYFGVYLNLLFAKGLLGGVLHRGGRSRTGRLLPPRPACWPLTLQAMMRGLDGPVTLVPVCLGYEHVMEVNTYHNELKGSRKEKELPCRCSASCASCATNYGRGFVNFGEPLTLNSYLGEHVPTWKESIGREERPEWMASTVNQLAELLMTRINDAAAVNGLTLSALALLAAERHALTRDELQAQLNTYLDLLKQVPYSPHSTMPDEDARPLLEQAMEPQQVRGERGQAGPDHQPGPLSGDPAHLLPQQHIAPVRHALPGGGPDRAVRGDLPQRDRRPLCRHLPLLKTELFLRQKRRSCLN